MPVTITCKLNVDEGGAQSFNSISELRNVALVGDGAGTVVHQSVVQEVGSGGWEAANIGDVNSSNRYRLCVRNMSAANYLLVSFDAGTTEHGDIPPGDYLYIPMKATKVVHLKFSSSAALANVVSSES